jgi:phosphatidylinositol alpha-mannosyltransferase
MSHCTKTRSKNAMAPKTSALKIGFVFDDSLDKPDGVQQYILSIGDWLRAQGHEVHYLVGTTTRSDLPNIHSLSRNVSVKFNGNGMSIPLPTSRRMLRAFLTDQQFDVLHVQVPYSPWLAGRLISAASSATAIIGTFHIVALSPLVNAATRFLGLYTHSTVKKFDEIVSVSTAAQSFSKQTYGVMTDVVPNAIDYQRFHSAKPLATYDDGMLTILFLGRLVPRKGCRLLLEALDLLKANHSNSFRVLICGKGPELESLQSYVTEHDLQDIIEFVGFVSEADKPAYYASADISVFPSSGGESFGIVLVEAMASGKAVVLGGNNSGYKSVLHDQPDLLFDATDAAKLANKLQHFMNDESSRLNLASWGAEYAGQFDQAVVGEELMSRYRKALQKRRRPEIL